MKNKRKILISGVASFAFLIVAEITLRLVWGFGKMPLLYLMINTNTWLYQIKVVFD